MQASLWASQFYCWTKFFRILYRYDFRFFLRYSNEGKCSLNGHFKNNTCVKRKKSKEMKNCKIKFCRLFFFLELHFFNFLWLPWLCGQVFEDFWRQFFKLSSKVWILGAFGETFGPKWQLKIPIRAKNPPQCLSWNSNIFIKSFCLIFLW